MSKQPSADELAAARDVIARAAAKDADAPRAALIALVTMPELKPVLAALASAQALNPADADVAYTNSMLHRLIASHTPA